jgi:1-deoxy-D-xylulose-5-phosphate synthase
VKPVVAIYSTFLQRAFDSIVHDVALQELPVLFCMDRAGLAGDDGPTHHGCIDIAYLLPVPGMTITAPKDGEEMVALLRTGIEWEKGPFAIRWPRDTVPAAVPATAEIAPVQYGSWELLREGRDVMLLATGTMVLPALEAANRLERRGVSAGVVNCRFIKPLDEETLRRLFPAHRLAVTIEEGTVTNGFGAFVGRRIAEEWPEVQVVSMGLPDEFVAHGERGELLAEVGLTVTGIEERVASLTRAAERRPLRETA